MPKKQFDIEVAAMASATSADVATKTAALKTAQTALETQMSKPQGCL